MEYIPFLTAFITGISCMWAFSLRQQLIAKVQDIAWLKQENDNLKEECKNTKELLYVQEKEYLTLLKEYEIKNSSFQDVQKYIFETKEQLVERMKSLSHEVLTSTQSHFLTVAKAHFDESQKRFFSDCGNRDEKVQNMLNPLKTSLEQMNKKIVDLEMLRKESQGSLLEQITTLSKETSLLIKALRHPVSRGKWGEVQLKRLVEMAGLLERCDFSVQETSQDSSLRADMVITLPNSRKIILDAKVPLDAYIKAIEASDAEAYDKEIELHVEHIEKHIKILADKKYWGKYQGAIDFTIMFLPSEALFTAALAKKATLMERALEKNILIATPTTLMALLHAIKLGWKETELHKDLHEVVQLAQEWFSRSSVFVEHLQKLGKSLYGAVGAYNTAINSFESRFLVTLRKLAKEQKVGLFPNNSSSASSTLVEDLETISVPISVPDLQ